MFWPILYTALTTIIAFLSLIFSEIKPIIDFGWMMTLGLITSFIITFTLLPTLINFVPKDNIFLNEYNESKITTFFGKTSQNNKNLISIEEKPKLKLFANTGLYILNKDIVKQISTKDKINCY